MYTPQEYKYETLQIMYGEVYECFLMEDISVALRRAGCRSIPKKIQEQEKLLSFILKSMRRRLASTNPYTHIEDLCVNARRG